MPKLDGFEVCRELRRRSMVPIIMVTARGEDFERIMGLDIGADDYILKPFSAGEVMARVRAILRRVQPREAEQQNLYSVGNLVIDLDKYLVTIGGADVTLTKKEVELLWTLAKTAVRCFRVRTCWTVSGVTIISATAGLWIHISSACGPKWISLNTRSGRSRPFGA